MGDHWIPFDEELSSMVEYHLFISDNEVLDHIAQLYDASRGYLQLCQEPCFWEECQVTVHHITALQIAESLSNAAQRVRALENRLAALEAEVLAIRRALGSD
eukprot:s4577_g3.t1